MVLFGKAKELMTSAILKHVNPYWSKFPSQVKRPSDFCSEIRYQFFRFVVKFNVLADFCESCKKSGVMSKVYAFDSACFYCCATLGTIGFSRVRGEFSVLAEGRHIFARVTKKTWQKPETALEKSLAPRVLLCRISEKSASGTVLTRL